MTTLAYTVDSSLDTSLSSGRRVAIVRGGSSAANGFIPFEGLSQKERYAEVLGHELVHAV